MFVVDYANGEKRRQQPATGQQKITNRKANRKVSTGPLLVYSLGDEMYKWVLPSGI